MRKVTTTRGLARDGRNEDPSDPVGDLLALAAESERRNEQWRGHVRAMLRQQEEIETRRGSALARAFRTAFDPCSLGERASRDGRVLDLARLVEAYERGLIEWALAVAHGCQKDAAALLTLRATTLHEKMKRLGVRPRRSRLSGRGSP